MLYNFNNKLHYSQILLLVKLILCYAISAKAQTPILIPDTIAGANIVLTMHKDSVLFFSGTISQTLAFNQNRYLGPTLILENGKTVNFTVNNQIGDTTTVHWHGLHVAPMNDGGPHSLIMHGMSWNPKFQILDKASTYWYHPHFHEKTAAHVIKGAAGMIIVRDSIEAKLSLPRKYGVDDIPIIVQSLQFDANNQIMYMGNQDSILLVNGTRANYGNTAILAVPAQVVRLRLLNASGKRTFKFGLSGNMPFNIIGSDGGLLNAPVNITRIRLSPGERSEILVNLSGKSGQTIYLMSYGSELATGIQGGPTMPGDVLMDSPLNGVDFNILQLNVGASTASAVTTIPSSLVLNLPWLVSQANITRSINFTAVSILSTTGPFFFNDSTYDMGRIDYRIPLDNIEIWELKNLTRVAHPFHIHDVQFYVLDRDGISVNTEEQGRKDNVLVEPNETVRFITKFETFADSMMPYVYHCHILLHEDDGMMGQFVVIPNSPTAVHNKLNDQNSICIFPNPSDELLRIKLKGEDLNAYSFKIVNMLGYVVQTAAIIPASGIDIVKLPTGIYLIVIEKAGKLFSGKFFKQ